jgi:hypothetical protein
MPNKREVREPFLFQLAQQLLEADEDRPEGSDGLTDKELYSTFAFIVAAVAFLVLTVGPFSLLK